MFHFARLKLTAWYLLMIMLVSIFFSIVIYANVDRELTRLERIQEESRARAEEYFGYAPPARVTTIIESTFINEARNRLLWDLAILNACIFLASGWVGYFLAGRTLLPIKLMIDVQSRFLGDASHELKTPLTAIRTENEIYLRSHKKTLRKSDEIVKSNLEEVVRLQHLTDSILELSKLEKIGHKLPFEKFDIMSVISESVESLSKIASSRRVRLLVKARKTEISGNKKSIKELINILLDNAIKYSPQNSKVVIKGMKKNNFAILKVEDQGIGISTNDQKHIFERFFRADKSRSGSTGYGLGLSIAKEIVDIHKGTIKVKSGKKGTVFTVELPLI